MIRQKAVKVNKNGGKTMITKQKDIHYCEHCGSRGHKTGDAVCNRFDKQDAKPEPSLQLLVIDIIGTCLVIAERGGIPKSVFRLPGSFLSDFRYYVDDPFDVVKTAIDGEKPDLRIEKDDVYGWKVCIPSQNNYADFTLSHFQRLQFEQLLGHPLPIYEGGVWKKLLASDSKVGIDIGECVSIWRFTR